MKIRLVRYREIHLSFSWLGHRRPPGSRFFGMMPVVENRLTVRNRRRRSMFPAFILINGSKPRLGLGSIQLASSARPITASMAGPSP